MCGIVFLFRYAEQVSRLQELQVKCYETEVPAVLAEFERLERARIAAVASALQVFLELERRLPKVTSRLLIVCAFICVFQEAEESLQRMDHAIASINVESDITEFVRISKSGAQPPPRAQYHP